MNPREHPDDVRRPVQPPDWETFGHQTHFTVLRGFAVENDRIVGYREEIDKYVRTHDLGDVLWPAYPILFANNLSELVCDSLGAKAIADVLRIAPGQTYGP
ncbi:MAG TPA: hypothetical protein VLM89_13240 [Phycisphaerae bacterium]|nr:hypothetical protein [Phycisphaerae bacterium]